MFCWFAKDVCPEPHFRAVHPLRERHAELAEPLMSGVPNVNFFYKSQKVKRESAD